MSNIHLMKLNDIPFDATKAKLKTIEIRLNDDKRKTLKVGDTLEFQRITGGEILRATVLAIRSYDSLQELTYKEDFSRTGGIYKNQQDWIRAINSYYSQEDQERFGLISIEIDTEKRS